MKNFDSFSAGSDIFSTGTVPYLPIITDRSLLPATGGRGDGYFSGWKIIRRLPQALKWAALRLRTIIIISSDGLGNEVKKDGGGGGGRGADGRGGGRDGYTAVYTSRLQTVPMW